VFLLRFTVALRNETTNSPDAAHLFPAAAAHDRHEPQRLARAGAGRHDGPSSHA
jgi:hypothetical protein